VGADGSSRYVTEGVLRASHRALGKPPLAYLGLPYHRSFERDVIALPRHPVELVFDLHPISYLFAASRRIRLTITCADHDNALTPALRSPPTVQIHRDRQHPSYLVIPVVAT
jgi:predicted acyl esterase